MDTSKNSHHKLAQAVQDAALVNINEDIQNICDNLEKITENIPQEVKVQLESLRKDIESLEGALKSVPEQFDADFAKKMNQILDTLKETDAHSRELRSTIKEDNHTQITKQAEQLANHFNRNLNDHSLISTWTLFKYGVACTIIGVSFGGVFSAMLVWEVFPKIF
ncbi:hypothetical protein A165_00950 [Vibrio tasmaniensis ZS-17]|uniref:hypothetical protein n=1 Tax=Vibrio tasmaniensis TaxID=212663 RepID=UPI0002F1A2E2|nr:hypothetical protein [Vibrio tasmaniensis]OED65913.1 hypothetical protein A165_00950 [Vibrio tasmaniensis ZS-17]